MNNGHQFNFFSMSADGSGIGIGGPNPIPLPKGYCPKDKIFDPSNQTCELARLMGANSTNPADYDAILKIADGAGGTPDGLLDFTGCYVAQGREDSVNFTNGAHDIRFSGLIGASPNAGLRNITDKGPNRNIQIATTFIRTPGTSQQVKLGDWLDQSYDKPDKRDLTKIFREDGAPSAVWVGNAPWPDTTICQFVSIPNSLALKAYWSLKLAVRTILGIPVGQPGPSWL